MADKAVKFTFYFFWVIMMLVIIVLCLEIYFRINVQYALNGIQYNNSEMWRWRKNLHDKTTNEEGQTFIIHTDNFGFRNYKKDLHKPKDVIRILVIGDSFTEGLAFADDKIFTGLLEHNLADLKVNGKRIEVISAASPAWGTDQEYLCLQNEGFRFEPDYVLLMSCPNDIRETYCKKFAELNPDGSVRFNAPRFDKEQIRYWKLSTHSYLFQYIQNEYWKTDYGTFQMLMDKYSFNFGKEDAHSWDRPIFLKTPFPELSDARKLYFTLVDKMNATCKEKNIKFAVSLVPMALEFDTIMLKDTAIQSGILSEQVQAHCKEAGIDYVDIYDRFKKDSDPPSHFLKSDAHFNAKGHEVTAEGLTEYYRGILK